MGTLYRIGDPPPKRDRGPGDNPLVWALVGGSAVMVLMGAVVVFALIVRGPAPAAQPPAAAQAPAAPTTQMDQAQAPFEPALPNGIPDPRIAQQPGGYVPQDRYTRRRSASRRSRRETPQSVVPPPAQTYAAPVSEPPRHSFGQQGYRPGSVTYPVNSRQPRTAGRVFSQRPQPSPYSAPPRMGSSPQDIIARTRGSVLLVLTEDADGLSSGTGFVVSSRQVATCEHVIRGARAIMVFTPDGRRFPASVASSDPRNDVAVLTVSGNLPPPLALGSFSQTREGDEVAVTGYPETFKMLSIGFAPSPSTTRGSISGRLVKVMGGVPVATLQTDTSVNHGNSGGPLYSLRDGTVYGLAAAMLSDTHGVNFASSVDSLRRLLGR